MKLIKSILFAGMWSIIMLFSFWFGAYVPSQVFSQATFSEPWSWIVGIPPIILGVICATWATIDIPNSIIKMWKKL